MARSLDAHVGNSAQRSKQSLVANQLSTTPLPSFASECCALCTTLCFSSMCNTDTYTMVRLLLLLLLLSSCCNYSSKTSRQNGRKARIILKGWLDNLRKNWSRKTQIHIAQSIGKVENQLLGLCMNDSQKKNMTTQT